MINKLGNFSRLTISFSELKIEIILKFPFFSLVPFGNNISFCSLSKIEDNLSNTALEALFKLCITIIDFLDSLFCFIAFNNFVSIYSTFILLVSLSLVIEILPNKSSAFVFFDIIIFIIS